MSICVTPDAILTARDYIPNHILEINVDHSLPVKVSHINSPSDFYVQQKEALGILDLLTKEMTKFYNENIDTNELVIPFSKLRNNHFGVTYYNDRIHRIRIEHFNKYAKDPTAFVFHIDFGFYTEETPNDLFYMMKRFAFFSQQAVSCKCAYIRPNREMQWKNDAKKRFRDLIKNRILDAQVVSFDEDRLVFEVILVDNNRKYSEINVNDALVDGGYAVLMQM